jgi:hypothetical protein
LTGADASGDLGGWWGDLLVWQVKESGGGGGDEVAGGGGDLAAGDGGTAAGVEDLAPGFDELAEGDRADEVDVQLNGEDVVAGRSDAGGGHSLASVEQGGDDASVNDSGRAEVVGFSAESDVGMAGADGAGLDAEVLVQREFAGWLRLGHERASVRLRGGWRPRG